MKNKHLLISLFLISSLGIYAQKQAAYAELVTICMEKSPKKNEVLAIIDDSKDDNYDSEFVYILYKANSELIPFFVPLDWKESVEELEAWLTDIVKENFGKTEKLFQGNEWDEDAIVCDEGVFAHYDNILRLINLQMSFVDTGNDEYVFIVHPVKDQKRVKQLFKILELEYQSVSDLLY